MPIYAAPKTTYSTDLHLVTDQSYGKFSLNSMIDHNQVTSYPLNNLTQFKDMLLDLQRKEPGRSCIAWKSDILEAYQILPMHPSGRLNRLMPLMEVTMLTNVMPLVDVHQEASSLLLTVLWHG